MKPGSKPLQSSHRALLVTLSCPASGSSGRIVTPSINPKLAVIRCPIRMLHSLSFIYTLCVCVCVCVCKKAKSRTNRSTHPYVCIYIYIYIYYHIHTTAAFATLLFSVLFEQEASQAVPSHFKPLGNRKTKTQNVNPA